MGKKFELALFTGGILTVAPIMTAVFPPAGLIIGFLLIQEWNKVLTEEKNNKNGKNTEKNETHETNGSKILSNVNTTSSTDNFSMEGSTEILNKKDYEPIR